MELTSKEQTLGPLGPVLPPPCKVNFSKKKLSPRPSLGLGTLDKHVVQVDRHTKLFGAFTFITSLLVIGMSIYVVHNTEFRFKSNRLMTEDQQDVSTARSASSVSLPV